MNVIKKWKAKVNNITDDAIYVYSIKFVRDSPTDTNIYDFDPIISIKPTDSIFKILFMTISSILGILGLFSLIYWRMERMKMKKEMERMNMNKK